MSAAPGWYPDPGGRAAMFRYWDGRAWSAALSPTPQAGPPTSALGQAGRNPPGGSGAGPGAPPVGVSGVPGSPSGSPQGGAGRASDRGPVGPTGTPHGGTGRAPDRGPVGPTGTPHGGAGRDPGPTPSAGGWTPSAPVYGAGSSPVGTAGAGKGWLIAGGAVLVVLVVVVAFIIRSVNSGGLSGNERPGGQSTRPICPPEDLRPGTQVPTQDGRVYGGKLSYPQLPPPWSLPSPETRVPFGRNAWTQNILVERYSPTQSWVASVLVAELNAGDGFFSPEEGSEIVMTCIVGAFYGNARVERDDRVNRAMTVDGHEAWVIESDLSFSIPNLQTNRERAIVVIVETGAGTSSLYYASIPLNTAIQWEMPARQAMADLRVDG